MFLIMQALQYISYLSAVLKGSHTIGADIQQGNIAKEGDKDDDKETKYES